MPGISEITVNMEYGVHAKKIPQTWDHLRRKVKDAKILLPQGAQDPIVNDDFGNVYGIFVAVTGNGYEYGEFYDYVDYIRRELLQVEGIKRIEFFGTQTESIDVCFSAEKLASMSINPLMIVQSMYDQGQVVNPGSIISGDERIRMNVGNKYGSIKEIEEIAIHVEGGTSIKLGDIAEVRRTLYEPKTTALTFNGERAISLAMSMESGVNVVEVGDRYEKKIAELTSTLPTGIEVNSIFSQPERVSYSIMGFVINLAESVLIVVLVLLIAMGLRSGLLIASGLIFTILGTFMVMSFLDIQLERISLAAIIVAMGMLVDNSIVVTDGILIDLKKGVSRKTAFTAIVKRTALPLLGATAIAILAFMPLGFTPGGVGEYLNSLFSVIAISLFLSWIFATVQTPYMATNFFKKSQANSNEIKKTNPYNTPFYNWFKRLIEWALGHKAAFLSTSVALLFLSMYSFQFVRFEFMPLLDYNQFVVEYKMQKGTDINVIEKDLNEISKELLTWDEIINVTTAAGGPPARYSLIRPMDSGGSNYGELIIDVEDYKTSVLIGAKILAYLHANYPQAEVRKREYGAVTSGYEIEVQFSGPDAFRNGLIISCLLALGTDFVLLFGKGTGCYLQNH